MALPAAGVGEGVGPTLSGTMTEIMQRIRLLRNRAPSLAVLQAVETLTTIPRAEEAAARGISGELLDQVIVYLEGEAPLIQGIHQTIRRVQRLAPAISRTEYS